jgi:hypothetical protein
VTVLWAADIFPLHAQVSILNADWQDYPDWGDGTGRVALGGTGGGAGVAVATALDVGPDGTRRIRMEIWDRGDDPAASGLVRLHNGPLSIPVHGIRVGNEESNDIHSPEFKPGIYWLEVWAEERRETERVVFVLDFRATRTPRGTAVHTRVVEWVSDDFPGFVKFELVDSAGMRHEFIDKVPLVDDLDVLRSTTSYPVGLCVDCDIIDNRPDGDHNLRRISLARLGLESTQGQAEFTVPADATVVRYARG